MRYLRLRFQDERKKNATFLLARFALNRGIAESRCQVLVVCCVLVRTPMLRSPSVRPSPKSRREGKAHTIDRSRTLSASYYLDFRRSQDRENGCWHDSDCERIRRPLAPFGDLPSIIDAILKQQPKAGIRNRLTFASWMAKRRPFLPLTISLFGLTVAPERRTKCTSAHHPSSHIWNKLQNKKLP